MKDEVRFDITEIFQTIQGEGLLQGVPSIFIRFAECNLRCQWCDTTKGIEDKKSISWNMIHVQIMAFNSTHIVITGGEPMLCENIDFLIKMLKNEGYHVTVETNGTIFKKTLCDLVSISPKLKHSGNSLRNLKTIYPEVIAQYIKTNKYQLKFVVRDNEADFSEIKDILAELPGVDNSNVLIMALSASKIDLEQVQKQIIRLCIHHNFRYTTRLQLHVWDNEEELNILKRTVENEKII